MWKISKSLQNPFEQRRLGLLFHKLDKKFRKFLRFLLFDWSNLKLVNPNNDGDS